MNQYEKLIDLIINEQEEQARELFHQIVVEKSREIYENIIDETDFEEAVHDDDQVEDLVNDIEVDKEGLPEAEEDEGGEMDMDDMGGDEEGADDEMDAGMDDMGGEEGGEEGLEDRVMDLEAALDELKAEFDALMSDEGGDEGGMDDMGAEEEPMMEEDDDVVLEYVNKVGNDWDKNGNQGEGKAVGAKSDSVTGATNTKSVHAGENRMGGTTPKIGNASEAAPDGNSPKGKAGGFLKPAQEIDVAKRNVNKPGGNKGAQNYFDKKETSYEKAKGAEGQTTGGKLPVNPKALQGGKVR